jgi:predicted aspartyl protease
LKEKLKVNGIHIEFVLDTGADVSIVTEQTGKTEIES